jgi:host factor-I protein
MDEANNFGEAGRDVTKKVAGNVSANGTRRKRRPSAANGTGHEALYLKSLVERERTVEMKLRDGERVRGCIEYFDDNIVRLKREGEPNLFLYKHHIQTIRELNARRTESAASGHDAGVDQR